MALLKVKFKTGEGAKPGFCKIDRGNVKIVNGKGEKEVTDVLEHRVAFQFEGPAGGTLDFEITQEGVSLVKSKVTISFGQTEGSGSGKFNLHTVPAPVVLV